jgi:Ala-tRNA(Pro) deacylase
MGDIYRFLEANDIAYERHDHPPVFTVEEAGRLVPPLPGIKIKNLFLCDEKGRHHFLVVVGFDKSIDLKALSATLGVKKIRFGSPKRLKKYLDLTPGAVTVLSVVNDPNRLVKVVIDQEVWQADALQCHPLVNTSTLVISLEGIRRLLEATGHEPRILTVPGRPE